MRKRALVVTLGLLLAVPALLNAGEKAAKKPRKPKPEPVSTADYVKSIQELVAVANELEGADAAAKAQELRDKVKAAAKNLRLAGRGLDRMLETEDNKALAARLKSYAANSLRGKITYERRKLIASKPELAEGLKQIQEKEKAVAAEKEAFYQKLRPQSADLDQLEKMSEALTAERDAKRKAEAEKRKAAMEARRKGGGKKEK